MNAKQRYNEAHYKYQCKEYPNVINDGHYAPPAWPKIATSNGLTAFICNYAKWTGNHLERTNNMGRPIDKTKAYTDVIGKQRVIGSIEWQKGSGINGTSDIKGHILSLHQTFPIPVYIEVKINKDTQSPEQQKYERKVSSTGALYCIIKTPEDFFSFYDYVINL